MIRLEDVLKTSWRCLEDVLKTYSQDEYIGLHQDVFWRDKAKVNIFVLIKTSSEDEYERRLQDVFIKTNVCWGKQGGFFDHRNYIEKKYVETTRIFRPSKLHQKKYLETTWIFRPSKLRRKKYVETTKIFQSAKLHRKSTWKWRGNSSKLGLQRIHVILMSNWRPSTWSARWAYISNICNICCVDGA